MQVHLIDGTYELFRHHFGMPPAEDSDGRPIGAIKGVVDSILGLLSDPGCTHVVVATDHVIESFRNDLFPGYKTGDGIDPDLKEQFHPLEEALRALGVPVWAMEEYEADDALAAGAAIARADARVTRVNICTPDKDLAQCVDGTRVVQVDRRRRLTIDHEGVVAKYGVTPSSIPDFLGLVGDSADGYPGLNGWGAKSAAAVLWAYPHYELIPADPKAWRVSVRGAVKLSEVFRQQRADADLYRLLATLRTDCLGHPTAHRVDDWAWRGPTPEFQSWAVRLGSKSMAERARLLQTAVATRLAAGAAPVEGTLAAQT